MSLFQLDPVHSSVAFSVKHMMIAKVHGTFEKVTGTLYFDKSNAEKTKAEANIEASSINTREPQRDAHLRSPDFFDVDKFPSLSFKSTSALSSGNGELKLKGELTIKGITKEVLLLVEGPTDELKDPYGQVKVGISASTKINRKDFGLTWNAVLEAGGLLVGEDVTINLDLQFVKIN